MAEKALHDQIRNTLRSITKECTLPQKKAVKDIMISLLREGTTIINHLVDEDKNVKVIKQSERFRRHLEAVDVTEAVEIKVIKSVPTIEEETVIAYDLSDIAKPHAKKMEGLSKVFDGSKRKRENGYTLHGISIANQPVVMQIHNSDANTLNQTRLEVIDRVKKHTGKKGIWVFDRGNDDQQFFKALKERGLRFVVRLRSNRHLINKDTGEILSVKEFTSGKYTVILPKSKQELTLIIKKHHPDLQPMRVLTNVSSKTVDEIIETYLERWDIENLFKQMKMKYKLESIRLLSLKKIKNLLALIQMISSLSNSMFDMVQQEENSILSLMFSHFCCYRSLSRNRFSFSSFLASMTPEIHIPSSRSNIPSLFSWRQLGKLGVF